MTEPVQVAGRPGWGLRVVVVCATAMVLAGSLGCSLQRSSADRCLGEDSIAMPVTTRTPVSAPDEPPSAPVEVLWTADESGALRAFDGRSSQALTSVDIGQAEFPPGLAFGGGLVWVYRTDGRIALVDPAEARVSSWASVAQVQPLADNKWYFAHGALWVAQPGLLSRLSPSGEVSSIELPTGFKTTAIAATDRWLWLAAGRRLVRVDPESRTTVTGDLSVDAGIGYLVGTHIGLLAVGWNQAQIWVLDPDTANLNSSIQVPNGELVMSVVDAGDALWVTGNCGHVMKVTGANHDPHVQKVKISEVSQDFPARIAFGSLWVADEVRSELVRVDLQTASVLARIPVDAADPEDPMFTVFAGERTLWLIDAKGFMRVDPNTNRILPRTLFVGASFGASVVAAPAPR